MGHTTVEGHSQGRRPSYQPAHAHTFKWVCASVAEGVRGVGVEESRGVGSDGVLVPAGQLKNSVEWRISTARDSRNT